MAAVCQLAQRLGIERLHLWTDRESLAAWYERHGWARVETMEDYFGQRVVIMARTAALITTTGPTQTT
jgi:N-acetylglutamate synthase-like GNAT family acetyltransferase